MRTSSNSPRRSRLSAVLHGRCPHCREGRIFSGLLTMRTTCPVCDIPFEREAGYFLMAIFIAYAIELALLAPVLVWLARSDAPLPLTAAVVMGALLVLAPLGFRWSRILWLHIDDRLHPHGDDAPPR